MGELLLIVWSIRRTVFGVEKASFNFWEYSPSSTNLVSDWLRAGGSPVDEEEIKIKMDDGVATGTSLSSEGFFKLICWLVGGAALSLGLRMT